MTPRSEKSNSNPKNIKIKTNDKKNLVISKNKIKLLIKNIFYCKYSIITYD